MPSGSSSFPWCLSGLEAARAERHANGVDLAAVVEGFAADANEKMKCILGHTGALDPERAGESEQTRLECLEVLAEDVPAGDLQGTVQPCPDWPPILESRDGGATID